MLHRCAHHNHQVHCKISFVAHPLHVDVALVAVEVVVLPCRPHTLDLLWRLPLPPSLKFHLKLLKIGPKDIILHEATLILALKLSSSMGPSIVPWVYQEQDPCPPWLLHLQLEVANCDPSPIPFVVLLAPSAIPSFKNKTEY